MYETFEHTADLGLRVSAPDLNTLFAEAGRGLFSMLCDNFDEIRPLRDESFAIEGTETDYLLFDWLSELLYRFETGEILFSDFTVEVTENGLAAQARGEPVDPERHQMAHEIKAITYHRLRVEQTGAGWEAEVIVDI